MLPVRTCLACRRRAEKPALLRLAIDRDVVTVDPPARQPGRGAYLCATRECLDKALRREGTPIARALRLRGPVAIDVEALLHAIDEKKANGAHEAAASSQQRTFATGRST